MKPGKRKLMAAGAAFLCTTVMAGCTTTSTTSNTNNSGQSSSEKTTLTFTFQDPNGQGANGAMYKWLEGVASTYPDKSVIIKPVPIQASENDFYTKLDLQMKSKNTAPDIVTEDTFLINSDASAGYLMPMNDQLKDWQDWNNGSFIEALKKGVTANNGTVYGVPYNTDSRGLWYNKDLFKQAGLPEDWNPKTWDDVLSAARTIKQKLPNVVPIWMNEGKATGEATSMQTYEMLLYGTGEQFIDSATGKWITKSQGIMDSLDFIQTINKEKLGPSLSLVLNGQAGTTSATEYLPQGKLAISLDGSWITGNYLPAGTSPWPEYKDVLGFTAMPTNNGQAPGTITLAGGWALSVPSNSKHQAEAMKFIEYALNKENMESLDIAQGNLTVRSDVGSDPQYTQMPFYNIATDFLKNAQFRPANDLYPQVSTQVQAMVESVASGTSPADAENLYAQNVARAVGSNNVIEK